MADEGKGGKGEEDQQPEVYMCVLSSLAAVAAVDNKLVNIIIPFPCCLPPHLLSSQLYVQ